MATVNQIVEATARRYGIDPRVAHAIVGQESGGSNDATSPVGAAGVMQIMPETGRGLGLRIDDKVDERRDPVKNIDAGMRFFKQQLDKYGSVPLALAAYNAGPGAVDKYGGVPPFQETQTYVKNIMGVVNRGGGSAPQGGSRMPPTAPAPEAPAAPTRSTAAQDALLATKRGQLSSIQASIQAEQKKNPDYLLYDDGKAATKEAARVQSSIAALEKAIAVAKDKPPAAGPKPVAPPKMQLRNVDGRVYGIDPVTGKSVDLGLGAGKGSQEMTPNEIDDNARGWEGVRVNQQNANTTLMREQIAEGRLDFDTAKDFLDRAEKLPPAVQVGDKWYYAGSEPGGFYSQLAKKYGFPPTSIRELNAIDLAAVLKHPEYNEAVLSGPYARQLNQGGVLTGQAAKDARLAGIATDKAAGALEGANVAGTETATPGMTNGVNPSPGEVDASTPGVPSFGAPPTPAQIATRNLPTPTDQSAMAASRGMPAPVAMAPPVPPGVPLQPPVAGDVGPTTPLNLPSFGAAPPPVDPRMVAAGQMVNAGLSSNPVGAALVGAADAGRAALWRGGGPAPSVGQAVVDSVLPTPPMQPFPAAPASLEQAAQIGAAGPIGAAPAGLDQAALMRMQRSLALGIPGTPDGPVPPPAAAPPGAPPAAAGAGPTFGKTFKDHFMANLVTQQGKSPADAERIYAEYLAQQQGG